MPINVEVSKNATESTANLIRRFTKRMQGAGIVQKMRGRRYFKRIKSRNFRRGERLVKLGRKEAHEELVRLGKAPEYGARRR